MKGFEPLKPSGETPEMLYNGAVWEKTYGPAGRLLDSATVKIKRTTRGTSFHAKPPQGGGGTKIRLYRFKSYQANYITCKSYFDNATEGSDDVLIAKQPELWFSVGGETLRGTAITYTDYNTGDQSRTASNGVTEFQVIDRPYVLNDLIWAASCISGVVVAGKDLGLIDLNRASRAWLTIA